MTIRTFLAAALAVVLATSGAIGAGKVSPESGQSAAWHIILDRAASQIADDRLASVRRTLLRRQIEYVRDQARDESSRARAEAEAERELLEALGPAPDEESQPEPAAITAQRAAHELRLRSAEARRKQADFAVIRAERMIDGMNRFRQLRLWRMLVQRGPSPFDPETLGQAWRDVGKIGVAIADAARTWARTHAARGNAAPKAAAVLGILVASLAVGWTLCTLLLRGFRRRFDGVASPGFALRLAGALVEGIARGLLPALILGALLVAPLATGLLTGLFGEIVATVLANAIMALLVAECVRVALAPDRAAWRLTRLGDASARLAARWVAWLVAFLAVANIVTASGDWFEYTREFDSVVSFALGAALAACGVMLLSGPVWEAGRAGGNRRWPAVRGLLQAAIVAAPVAAAFGYAGFAKFLLANIVLTGLLVGGIAMLRGLAHELLALAFGGESRTGDAGPASQPPDEPPSALFLGLAGVVDVALIGAGVLAAISIWGVSADDISAVFAKALRGVSVGSYTFSLTDLILAVAVFFIVLTAVRAVQYFLETRVLPGTRLDAGIQHSLKKAVGYVGLVIALVLAISTFGINFSNITIIAGALSVGIGFGLQNLVNNFVSGLILLIERPIRVGDWVVVGSNEGYVQRINVRSTEITTFQKASVIIPNADILSSAVTNWTHKDPEGRIEIDIGVSYGSDIEAVQRILIDCAAAHPSVLANPAPKALLMNFGRDSLDFQLRVFVMEIGQRWDIASGLRIAIYREFAKAGITIPFPQRVVHIRRDAGAGGDRPNT